MVKAIINNFESLALSGKTLGNLTYSTRKSVGKRSDTDTAVVNINGSLDTLNIEPQAGFDFGMPSKTPLKQKMRLIGHKIQSRVMWTCLKKSV
ncbi:MAG: hypothetical protein ABF445_10430 [Leuconostoc mesenteroides]